MASGIFLIGNGLSIQGFDTYIQPVLEEKGYSIPDKLEVSNYGDWGIFISIVGEGNLEEIINNSLVQVGKYLEKEMNKKGFAEFEKKLTAWQHQVSHFLRKEGEISVYGGKFKVIGVYQEDTTASKLFPPKAQEILLENLRKKLYETEKEFKSTLKHLGQRLSNI